MSTIESICADLGVTIAQCHEPTDPLRTKAGQTLRRMLLERGEDMSSSRCARSWNHLAMNAR
jgi:hypothetical protein